MLPARSVFSKSTTLLQCNFTSVSKDVVKKTPKSVKIPGVLSFVPVRHKFFEANRKGSDKYDYEPKRDLFERIPHGYSVLKDEWKIFVQEVKETIHHDPKIFLPGDTDVIFRFENQDCLKKWQFSSDKTHKEGNSECQLIINDQGKAVFSGVIDTKLPKDGKCRRTGYCAMKSHKVKKSFQREHHYEWYPFTHLEFRIRGDGRNYAIGLGTDAYYDVNWLDLYTYILHTHGGPYWQVARIPFSKFFLTHKGRIQDKQGPVNRDRIDCISILCAAIPGPFRLEIDYIGVHCDGDNIETFAYELYDMGKEYVTD